MSPPFLQLIVFSLSGLRRFPLAIMAALIATTASIISIHSSLTPVDEQCQRIILTMIFALPSLIGAVYASDLYPRFQGGFHAVAAVTVAGVFLLLPAGMHGNALWFRFWMLLITSFAVASAIPGLIQEGNLNWWRVNVGWLNSLVLAAIMTGIIEIGLQLALLSAEKLFGLESRYGSLMGRLHQDLFVFGGLLVCPVAAMALFPPAKGALNAEQPGFKVWANLCKYALIPIGFLFMGILAAYSVKILIQWKLPNGMVATPVLALGAYGTLAMLLILPWKSDRFWARWFSWIYPPAFLLSTVLLFISLGVRFKEYGVTFDRYSALAAGIWLAVSTFCFLIRWKQAPLIVPALLSLMALVAALGPLSAGNLSLRSQSERLTHLLEAKTRNDEQIRSIVRMIVLDFGLSDLERVTGALGLDPKLTYWELTEAALKKLNISKSESSKDVHFYELSEGTFIPIAGCAAYLTTPANGWNGSRPCLLGKNAAGEELMLKTSSHEELRLILHAGGREIASKGINDLDFDAARKNKSPILFTLEGEGRSFFVLITRAQWSDSAKTRKVFNIQYQVFEKPIGAVIVQPSPRN